MLYLVLCVHNHQPVGNFEHVLEDAYANAYWPFLKALSRHPSIKFTLHNSGFLLDWLIRNRSEYVELLRSMVGRGQVEMMGGGYYEPILQVIPEADRVGQIRMMSERIEGVFGERPRGIWLAERVWEPTLPGTLKAAGVEYLLVDDFHFIKSGLLHEDLGGYYITEDQGRAVRVFPGSERLRYMIPFKPADEVVRHLKDLKPFLRRGNAAIYGDDGEKFGVWPGTGKWVYEDGWLERFLEKIEENSDWLKPVRMGEYLDGEAPLGRVYLPNTSYMEMGEWALPMEASRAYTELVEEMKKRHDGGRISRFLQGGTWRNFLSKYPESNWMHKRMLVASAYLRAAELERPDDEPLKEARVSLYRAQCNDAYWHGVFGGLYLPHLRTEVYRNILRAEEAMGVGPDGAEPAVFTSDVDTDGSDEVIMRNGGLNLFISPSLGGSLVEMDVRGAGVNLSNTLTRWSEGYHHGIKGKEAPGKGRAAVSIHDLSRAKEKGLEEHLLTDPSRRTSFKDHFLSEGETLEAFRSNAHRELGSFHTARYEHRVEGKRLVMSSSGRAAGAEFSVTKTVRMTGLDSFSVSYSVEPLSGAAGAGRAAWFAVELNFILPCCDGPACTYRIERGGKAGETAGLGTSGVSGSIEGVSLVDAHEGVSLHVACDGPAALWRFPVYTVSLSEGGFEKIFQGSCLVFLLPLAAPGDGSRLAFSLSLKAGRAG
jgi:alpha-amylase